MAFLGLATNATLTAVENEIPHVSNLVKNTDPKEKTSDIESKYFKTTDYDKLTSQPLDAKITQKESVDKSVIAWFINKTDLNIKVVTLAWKQN